MMVGKNMNTLVVGTQWGDEAKGKIVDYLADENDIVARYNGGDNAGHTIHKNGKDYVLHFVPSGILHDDKINLMCQGMVVNPKRLIEEVRNLRRLCVNIDYNNLQIDWNVHLILPYHVARDKAEGGALGTTGKGIGPAYEDKIGRRGIRLIDLRSPDLEKKVVKNIDFYNKILPEDKRVKAYDVFNELENEGEEMLGFVADTSATIRENRNKKLLLEGAQGALLDISTGTYPFVTSSNTGIGGVYAGIGTYLDIHRKIGVVKTPMSRVGEGPFMTELGDYEETKKEKKIEGKEREDFLSETLLKINEGKASDQEIGRYLRVKGGEYGATTGRPRRIGWLDMELLRYAADVNGLTEIALTKMDVYSGMKELKICTGYRLRASDFRTPTVYIQSLKKDDVTLINIPGWEEDIRGLISIENFPGNAIKYFEKVETLAGVPISMISTGPGNEDLIVKSGGGISQG